MFIKIPKGWCISEISINVALENSSQALVESDFIVRKLPAVNIGDVLLITVVMTGQDIIDEDVYRWVAHQLPTARYRILAGTEGSIKKIYCISGNMKYLEKYR